MQRLRWRATDVGFHHRWAGVSQSRPLNESENIFKANIINPIYYIG